jgi:ribosome-associated protein
VADDRPLVETARAVEPEDDAELLGWVRSAARAAASKTDAETVVLSVGDVLSITSWFVVTGGRNARQVKAVAEEVEAQVAAAGGPKPIQIEGLDSLRWVLLDYGDFVVHVLVDEAREYYALERLWSDVPRLDW